MAVNVEDAGFELFDVIVWMYGQGFPKSHNIEKALIKKCTCGNMEGYEYSEQNTKRGVRPLSDSAIIFSSSGNIVLLVTPSWDATRVAKKSCISDVRGGMNLAQDLGNILQELKMTGTLGVIGSNRISEDIYKAINGQAKIELAEDMIEEISREKTEEELDFARKAARIADVGLSALLEHARVGISEYELAAEIGYAMQAAGSEGNFNLFSSGKHSHEMHPPFNKRLEEGDIIIAEITPFYHGQSTQLCSTVVLGKPTSAVIEKYDLLLVALKNSLKCIGPGVPASTMAKAMNKVISEAGYGKYCYPPYMRTRGHGLSPASLSPGHSIDEDTKAKFEKDQVIVVHPNQWFPETGYLACGETVLVTESGIERLAQTESKLYIKE